MYKLSIIVQLLLGEIPDRSIFSQKGMVASLKPYLHIAQVGPVFLLFSHALELLGTTVDYSCSQHPYLCSNSHILTALPC